jgi:hypothetical protein
MIRIATLVLFAMSQIPAAVSAASCAGADTAITSLKVASVSHTQYANIYHVTVTVANIGHEPQSGDVLPFVDVMYDGNRLDEGGMPPLAAGATHAYTYDFKRSNDAGANTTTLNFHVRYVRPDPPGREDCDRANDYATITF